MSRAKLLAAAALALVLAAPAYSQSASPSDDSSKPTQLERQAPADNPGADKAMPGTPTPDSGMSGHKNATGDKAAPDKAASADKATTQPGGFITQQATNQTMAEKFIGMKVESPKKENIGKVSDLVLDDQNRIVGAVLSVGGFLGIGDKHVALAWNELQIQDGREPVATISMTKDQLKSAPEFKTQADLQAQQEAERRKLEAPAKPTPGTGMGGTTAR